MFLLTILFVQITSAGIVTSQVSNYETLTEPRLFDLGVQADDYLGTQNWGGFWQSVDPLEVLNEKGAVWSRVGVCMKNDSNLQSTSSWCSVEYSGEVLRRSAELGMKLNLFFFLSDEAAHAGQQPCPSFMKNFTIAEKAYTLRRSCYYITKYYMEMGLDIDIYDIGNEIEFGILDERPPSDGSVDWFDTIWLKNNSWKWEAEMLKGAIAGVRAANPSATILLHIANSHRPYFVSEFFKFMQDSEVPFDLAGLSFYPSSFSERPTLSTLGECIEAISELGLKTMISEFAYPSAPNPHMSDFDNEVEGWPLTPEGQSKFVSEFLHWCYNQKTTLGAIYYAPTFHLPATLPEYHASSLSHFALFYNDTALKPAVGKLERFHTKVTIFRGIKSNSTVSNFSFIETQTMIGFWISGPDSTKGYCDVSIPLRSMMGPFLVFIDNVTLSEGPTVTSNSSHSSIYFTYDHSFHYVAIYREQPSFTNSMSGTDFVLVVMTSAITLILAVAIVHSIISQRK